ncbi:MAG: efflux RND transporter permease subunit [Desulfobacteraceae bacterium]|nr:MAG: efflux RND transporter permease subunit [Desulfobacteraceae bacterium]
MKPLARWSVEHRVTVNLLMVFVIIVGLLALTRMKREVFPQFSLDMIYVRVVYPGASPEEIEEGIIIKIEEKIKSIEGIRKIISKAEEGVGTVLLELKETVDDIQKVVDEIKTQVDTIDTFPEDAEMPLTREVTFKEEAINIAIYGNVSELALRQVAEKVREDLLTFDSISQVNLAGVRDYEISVEVSEEDLRRYRMTFDQIAAAVKTGSLDLPGGVIKAVGGEVLIRTKGQRYAGREFENIPLITLADGTIIRLGDLARVIDGFQDTEQKGHFNGQPAALVQVRKTRDEDLINIARRVNSYIQKNKHKLPPGIHMAPWGDLSLIVQDRIDLLVRNGIQGIILVFISLAIFLRFGLAFWVALGIPISFMGAFYVLYGFGESINMMSLFAFIMTLGILVDDAIIIGENIFAHYERGEPPIRSIINGTGEVGVPVLMAVSTTIVAFMPLLYVTGIMGKFIKILPIAVITILVVSLWEAFVILPAHLAGALERDRRKIKRNKMWHTRFLDRIQNGLQYTIKHIYGPMLTRVLKNRYFTFIVGLGVLIIIFGLIKGRHVPYVLFPKPASNYIQVQMSYPLGTPASLTEATVKRIEGVVPQLNEEFSGEKTDGRDIVLYSFSLTGIISNPGFGGTEIGGHAGQVFLELLPAEERSVTVTEVVNRWRELVGEIPGTERLSFSTLTGGPGGNPIEIQLTGHDFKELQNAANELKFELSRYQGTFDITDNFKPGKVEIKIRAKESARPLGITLADLARQVRQAFYGEEAARLQRGRDDVKVMIRYSESERRTLGTIEEMRIRNTLGTEVPFGEVAEVVYGRGYSVINRVNRQRQITVMSDLDENVANAERILGELGNAFLPELITRYPSVKYSFEGQRQRSNESVGSLFRGFVIAILAIYLLLATQFRSYIQPVIIMAALPFGMVGSVLGHLIMGLPITLLSLLGVVALSGIVVNDSILLLDFINRSLRKGTPIRLAVEESGKSRFRAVILTSLTTIAGLLPLLTERSFQAQFLIPMAVSICFGLLVATVLTLLFVPALYLIVVDISTISRRLVGLKPIDKPSLFREGV